jgi:hypothetical protein
MRCIKGRAWEDYRPVKNPMNPHSGYEGCLLETFEPELDIVRRQYKKDPTKVWTVIDYEDGLYITAGVRMVNRIGYLITEVSWESETVQFDERDRRVSN